MSTIGTIHFAMALAAIVSGLVVLLLPKGNQRHRLVGWAYAASMLGLNGTAFMLYRLFGHFGPFHVAAVVSLLTVLAGVATARFRKPKGNWMLGHAYWMTWSYVGLLAAAVSEIATRVPESPFWGMVFVGTFVVVGAGSVLIRRGVPRALQRLTKRAVAA